MENEKGGGERDWVADSDSGSGSGSVLLVEGLDEGRKR